MIKITIRESRIAYERPRFRIKGGGACAVGSESIEFSTVDQLPSTAATDRLVRHGTDGGLYFCPVARRYVKRPMETNAMQQMAMMALSLL